MLRGRYKLLQILPCRRRGWLLLVPGEIISWLERLRGLVLFSGLGIRKSTGSWTGVEVEHNSVPWTGRA